MAVVGSGIMAERLSGGNVAIALLANTVATGAALVALILTFGPISRAHLNPPVTLADASQRGIPWREVLGYLVGQILGEFLGVGSAHLMFGLSLFSSSTHARSGTSQVFSEFIATFGLLSVIWGCSRLRSSVVPFAIGAYITAAYWFTSSASFANPAVTLARAATDTFSGIRPTDAPGFIVAELVGAGAATALFRRLIPALPAVAPDLVVRHAAEQPGRAAPRSSLTINCDFLPMPHCTSRASQRGTGSICGGKALIAAISLRRRLTRFPLSHFSLQKQRAGVHTATARQTPVCKL